VHLLFYMRWRPLLLLRVFDVGLLLLLVVNRLRMLAIVGMSIVRSALLHLLVGVEPGVGALVDCTHCAPIICRVSRVPLRLLFRVERVDALTVTTRTVVDCAPVGAVCIVPLYVGIGVKCVAARGVRATAGLIR
jgi:hypothetical protein